MRPGGRYAIRDLPFDLVAGVALAAIAVPSQMATAHLAGFAAFAAGSVGFALLGANRYLVICADSTIAPIFAGGLAHLAVTGTHAYFVLVASFALMVGGILFCAGLFRLGWLANLVSIPVTAGFLAGIAIHIIISQLPFLLSIAAPKGDLLQQASEIASHLGETRVLALVLGLFVFGATVYAEWINPRIPGALIGIVAATAAVFWFQLEREGVAVLGPVSGELQRFHIPSIAYRELVEVIPLAFVVAAVVMVQSAATTRAFPGTRGTSASINRDFTGIGAANREASSIIDIDFTAAQILLSFIKDCAQRKISMAVARLESLRAQDGFERFGITDALPRTHLFHSVDEAIRALGKKSNEFGTKS